MAIRTVRCRLNELLPRERMNRMPIVKTIPSTSRLRAALPMMDRRRLIAACEPIQLTVTEVLAESGKRIRHVYFPTDSFISVTTPVCDCANLEVGMVGNEGMLGVSLILGVSISPIHAVVQSGGTALRMSVLHFRRQLELSDPLLRLLKRYLFVVIGQFAQSSACTRFHVVEARLARCLLMTQDRAHSAQFHMTHEFLAAMLGVRRECVSIQVPPMYASQQRVLID